MSIKNLLQNPWLVAASLLLNVILFVSAFYILQKAQHYYKEYRLFRPQAHGSSEASSVEVKKNRDTKLLVMYGDSRIQEWKPLPQIDNTEVINAGISGETTIEMRRRLDHDVLRLKPDTVMIQAGMNDLTAAVTRGINSPDQIIATMKNNFEWLIETLIDQGIDVIVTPLIPAKPLGVGRKLFWHDELDALTDDLNGFLKSLADKHKLLWVDLLEPMYDQEGQLRTEWYFDTLHLHTDRYATLNDTLVSAIRH